MVTQALEHDSKLFRFWRTLGTLWNVSVPEKNIFQFYTPEHTHGALRERLEGHPEEFTEARDTDNTTPVPTRPAPPPPAPQGPAPPVPATPPGGLPPPPIFISDSSSAPPSSLPPAGSVHVMPVITETDVASASLSASASASAPPPPPSPPPPPPGFTTSSNVQPPLAPPPPPPIDPAAAAVVGSTPGVNARREAFLASAHGRPPPPSDPGACHCFGTTTFSERHIAIGTPASRLAPPHPSLSPLPARFQIIFRYSSSHARPAPNAARIGTAAGAVSAGASTQRAKATYAAHHRCDEQRWQHVDGNSGASSGASLHAIGAAGARRARAHPNPCHDLSRGGT